MAHNEAYLRMLQTTAHHQLKAETETTKVLEHAAEAASKKEIPEHPADETTEKQWVE